MNIKEAKTQIKNTVKIYLKKNKLGGYEIPIERQRPIFMIGAPGIGKTEVMAQVAGELGIALVAYSMTHHTRQSALGLPFITKKKYGSQEYDVSEYTMSEIIASVYESIEASGMSEGILFLDEINCVSETLAPAMLQFLQYKVFGRCKVPEGWVVAAAGNPPEYNRSVREFDVVTLDRLKILDVASDYKVWREYASSAGIHGSIISYLDIHGESEFYAMETTVKGKEYVTARGWTDLSEAMKLCEDEGIDVDEPLISQYLRRPSTAKKFAVYYALYSKYKDYYKVKEILDGKAPVGVGAKLKNAKFDERLSFMGLMVEPLRSEIKAHMREFEILSNMVTSLRAVRESPSQESFEKQIEKHSSRLNSLKAANTLDPDNKHILGNTLAMLNEYQKVFAAKETFKAVSSDYSKKAKAHDAETQKIKKRLENAFQFIFNNLGEGHEMTLMVTDLTIDYYSSKFIASYGCDEYFKYNKSLQINEREREINAELEKLTLEEAI
jgi:hypothetical protein